MTLDQLISRANNDSSAGIGSKAQRLLKMENAGFNVPRFVVIDSDLLANWFNPLDNKAKDEEWIPQLFNHLQTKLVAVRSAGLDEDGAEYSFAGQYLSLLNIESNQLLNAIEKVYDSRLSKSVLDYRLKNNLKEEHRFSIIIQKMIPASHSGVAFTKNPVNGQDQFVLNVTSGLGDRLVAGEINGEHLVLETEKTVKSQHLNPFQIKTLCEVSKKIEGFFQCPQDIEFCFEGEQLWILQSRNITTKSEQAIVWDNSNIIESFPGVTLPLTFSFISKVYEQAYWQLLTLLGAPTSILEANKPVFASTLGLIDGRVYYNLYAWYKMLSFLPGYSINKDFMEKMMGVKESFELRDFTPMSGVKAWWHLCTAIVKIVTNLLAIQKMRGRFLKQFHQELNHFKSLQLEELSNEELMSRYQDFESRILGNWKAPLVNDFFTMIFFGSFQKLLEKNNIQHLHNDLLVGSRDIISVKPVNFMISLIDAIKSDEQLLQVFENQNNQEALNVVRSKHTVFFAAFQSYISEFGNRCGEELKLETKTFVTHPERLIEVLKGHLKADTGKVHIDNHVIRENAEKVAIEKVKNKRLFRFMLSKTRTFVSNRENLRYERTSAFAIARKIFRQIGANWKRSGIIDDEDDIFYLNMDEIFSKIKGNSKDLKDTVDKRKRLYEQYSKQHLTERLTTINGIIQPSESKSVDPSKDLQGIGCCPGIVRGNAIKLEKPKSNESLDGKILLARSTDPGWVTLFASAQALVVERGSLLSHSAIVAREMGIPCVVNIPDLFDSTQEGEELEINGTTGTVKRLSV